MKKGIKLILIFLLVAGLVFLLLNLDSLFGNRVHIEEGGDLSEEITKECDKIREEWAEAKGWDESLFVKQSNAIDQGQKLKKYSSVGYQAVTNTLRESSINTVCDAYWYNLRDRYDHKALQSRYSGVSALSKYKDYASDDRIKHVKNVHGLYTKVYNFTHSNHTLSPNFNPEAGSGNWWTSYEKLREGVLSLASSYKSNSLYREISSVPGFNDGLDPNHLNQVLSAQKESFYQSLSQQIISSYSGKTPTSDLVSQLNAVVDKYGEEYYSVIGSNRSFGMQKLDSFVRDYGRRLREDFINN